MKVKALIVVLFLFSCTPVEDSAIQTTSICDKYDWGSVTSMVSPYMDNYLHTALIMQGQSSDYNSSEAARQAFSNDMPERVKAILKSIIEADCE